jgi:acyl-CoA thioesterase
VTPFRRASRFDRIATGEHRGEIDAGWAQGRGVYGGLVTAMLVRALEADAPKGQAITTITTAFVAPATAGPAVIRTEAVRAGRNVSTFRASLLRDDATLATCLATFARQREGALAHRALAMPDAPRPELCADGPEEHYIPAFARRFEFRQTHGPRPFSGGADARVAGWCRLVEDDVALDAALASALLDAWPPAAVAVSPGWCPVASVELTYHFVATLPIAMGKEWLFYDAHAGIVGGGLADESATLWRENGELVATSRQLIALFPPEARAKE